MTKLIYKEANTGALKEIVQEAMTNATEYTVVCGEEVHLEIFGLMLNMYNPNMISDKMKLMNYEMFANLTKEQRGSRKFLVYNANILLQMMNISLEQLKNPNMNVITAHIQVPKGELL